MPHPPADLTRAAISATDRGWAVFPCWPAAKIPWCRNGASEATVDTEGVAAHWEAFPTHNVGLATGPSDLVVIDADTPKPEESLPGRWQAEPGIVNGADVFAALCERAQVDFPITRTVRTPNGGWHWYFATPPGVAIRNSAKKLAPMLDVRGVGGYVLAAGSVVDGRLYQLVIDVDPLPLPYWLTAALLALQNPTPAGSGHMPARQPPIGQTGAYGDAIVARCLREIAAATPGQRHVTFVSRVATLARHAALGHLDMAALEPLLYELGRAQDRTNTEIATAIRSARAKIGGTTACAI